MIRRHDISFAYSDDPGVYRRGVQEQKAIHAYAKDHNIGDRVFEAIWNDVVMEAYMWEFNSPFIVGAARHEHAENIAIHHAAMNRSI
jgi:hypothetical protein